MRSPINSSKKIGLALLLKGTVVNKTTTERRLTDKFELKANKLAKKSGLTRFIKAKRYAIAKARLDWTTENWRKVLFSDESTVQQYTSRK